MWGNGSEQIYHEEELLKNSCEVLPDEICAPREFVYGK